MKNCWPKDFLTIQHLHYLINSMATFFRTTHYSTLKNCATRSGHCHGYVGGGHSISKAKCLTNKARSSGARGRPRRGLRPRHIFFTPPPAGPRPGICLTAPPPARPSPRINFQAPPPAGPSPRQNIQAPHPAGSRPRPPRMTHTATWNGHFKSPHLLTCMKIPHPPPRKKVFFTECPKWHR